MGRSFLGTEKKGVSGKQMLAVETTSHLLRAFAGDSPSRYEMHLPGGRSTAMRLSPVKILPSHELSPCLPLYVCGDGG